MCGPSKSEGSRESFSAVVFGADEVKSLEEPALVEVGAPVENKLKPFLSLVIDNIDGYVSILSMVWYDPCSVTDIS